MIHIWTPVKVLIGGTALATAAGAGIYNHQQSLYQPDLEAYCTLQPGIIQVSVTNPHASAVNASTENIDLYDSLGNLLGTVHIPLGVTNILPGDTISASYNDPYENTAACVLDGYTP